MKYRKLGKVVDSAMSSMAKLSIALRLLPGSDKADIGLVHGVHTNKPNKAMQKIVDFVNLREDFKIKFLSHEEEKTIAKGFKTKSTAKFSNCIGCIDRMLLWCYKFSSKDLHRTMIGPIKLLNGRKYKFGINLLAMHGYLHQFIDTDLHYLSVSDYLALAASLLCKCYSAFQRQCSEAGLGGTGSHLLVWMIASTNAVFC